MKKISKFLILIAIISRTFAQAQELGEMKLKDKSFKENKLNEGSKKLYIQSFHINFEVYSEAEDKKAAGGFRNTITSAAKAKAAVGLATLDNEAIQAKADELYQKFLNDMKSQGYEIISDEAAAATEEYEGHTKVSGPAIFESEKKGTMVVIPTGYSYFYKSKNIIQSQFSIVSKTPQNLSKELDNCLVASITLNFLFSELGTDWNVGNQAKVKLLVNYRMSNTSTISFARGKYKIGGNPESSYLGYLKSDLEIDGVLKKEKVVAYSTQSSATATSLNPIVYVNAENYSQTTKWLNPDGKLYAQGIYLAGNMFISEHLNIVFKK
jgi:hypothetical protein